MTTDPMCPQIYYRRQSVISEPGSSIVLFSGLPRDISSLCAVVQGLLIHYREGDIYGLEIPDERKHEIDTRLIAPLLLRVQEIDDRALTIARSPEHRGVGCCRDFALLLCAMLRWQGVPARTRFGFSRYFDPNFAFDHVVCEYWCEDKQRWTLVDPQQDALHRKINKLTFDPYDVPRDQFLTAGTAWTLCRRGQADASVFGYAKVPDLRGWLVLRNYLVHDLAALNGMELLIWDLWGIGGIPEDTVTAEHMALLDRVAAVTDADDDAFPSVQSLYNDYVDLRVPAQFDSWSPVTRDCRTITCPEAVL